MKRRDVLKLVGGAASWPLVAHAQQPAMPVIGFLSNAVPGGRMDVLLAAFRDGLAGSGYVEGKNVELVYRWTTNSEKQFSALAADLVRRQVSLIATTGGDASAIAAKAATSTIPIIFATSGDPVKSGLVASLNRPGANLTGVSRLSIELLPKRLEVLREIVPDAAVIGFLVNHTNMNAEFYVQQVATAARSLERTIQVFNASTPAELEADFAAMAQMRIGALLIGNDAWVSSRINQLAELTLRYKIPAIYEPREFVAAGGLASYGTNLADAYRLVGAYAGRILKGEKPSDLPVQQQSKIEFVINLKTVRAFGLNIPLPLIGRADEVIE